MSIYFLYRHAASPSRKTRNFVCIIALQHETRRKARYLGIYKGKCVWAIGRIVKVAACNINFDAKTVTALPDGAEAVTAEEEQRILGAGRKAHERGWDLSMGHKFYLCDAMEETAFRKTSPGGIMGHRYFDLQEVLDVKTLPSTLNELGQRLRQHTWN